MREWLDRREKELKAEQQRALDVYQRIAGALMVLAETREQYEQEEAAQPEPPKE